MEWLIIIISYVLISIIVSIVYVGVVLTTFMLMKKVFRMNEARWEQFFSYKKGLGLYLVLVIPYFLTLAILYPPSLFWFDWLDVTYKVPTTSFIFLLLVLITLWKLPKLKDLRKKLSY